MSKPEPVPNGQQLVPVTPIPAGEVLPAPILSAKDTAFWCSAKTETEIDKLRAVQALQNESFKLCDVPGREIAVRIIVGHWTKEVENSEGEVVTLRRFAFVEADGTTYSGSGDAVRKTAALLVGAFGPGPWDDPVVIKVRLKPTGKPQPAVLLDVLGRLSAVNAKSKEESHAAKPAGKPGK